ncbi:MAG: tyrosine-type recombinase/integrase [Alphaproteobacteria bacterium]|nr:tyrosine-type recombinase/integrase [Alphaproteobacteria bacterium]
MSSVFAPASLSFRTPMIWLCGLAWPRRGHGPAHSVKRFRFIGLPPSSIQRWKIPVRNGPDIGEKVTQKTKNKSAIPVTVPISPKLLEAIDVTPTGDETFLVTEYGHPFTAGGFGEKMVQWPNEAGVRASIATQGMRKTVGINMAENDASPYEIMAVLGHSSPKSTQVYKEAANRRKLARKAASKSTLGQMTPKS